MSDFFSDYVLWMIAKVLLLGVAALLYGYLNARSKGLQRLREQGLISGSTVAPQGRAKR